MYPDVTALERFYATPKGHHCAQLVGRAIARAPPARAPGAVVDGLAVGFGMPFCTLRAPVRLMPSAMGVLRDTPGAVLCAEDQMPLADATVGAAVVAHVIEHTVSPPAFLRELWRVLAPEGSVTLIAPNRRSLWSLSDRSPFGQGRPYSRGQLRRVLDEAMFEPISWHGALYGPPASSQLGLRLSRSVERWGRKALFNSPGVWVVVARKRLSAPVGKAQPALRRQPATAAG